MVNLNQLIIHLCKYAYSGFFYNLHELYIIVIVSGVSEVSHLMIKILDILLC